MNRLLYIYSFLFDVIFVSNIFLRFIWKVHVKCTSCHKFQFTTYVFIYHEGSNQDQHVSIRSGKCDFRVGWWQRETYSVSWLKINSFATGCGNNIFICYLLFQKQFYTPRHATSLLVKPINLCTFVLSQCFFRFSLSGTKISTIIWDVGHKVRLTKFNHGILKK